MRCLHLLCCNGIYKATRSIRGEIPICPVSLACSGRLYSPPKSLYCRVLRKMCADTLLTRLHKLGPRTTVLTLALHYQQGIKAQV